MNTKRLNSTSRLAGFALGILLGACAAHAQYVPQPATGDAGAVTDPPAHSAKTARGDQKILTKLTALSEEEVVLARIAAERAANPQVRSFAAEMVHAHSAANQEITSLAQKRGVTLSADETASARKTASKWAKKAPADLDEEYIEAAVDNHKKAIELLKDCMDSKDPEIAALANRLLPTMTEHLNRAQTLEKQVGYPPGPRRAAVSPASPLTNPAAPPGAAGSFVFPAPPKPPTSHRRWHESSLQCVREAGRTRVPTAEPASAPARGPPGDHATGRTAGRR